MLIRISLILAVVAALAVGAVNIFVVKDKITTLTTIETPSAARRSRRNPN